MTRPYWKGVILGWRPPMDMTTAKWKEVPLEFVRFEDLILTQNGVYFHGITHGTSVSGDDKMHVARYGEDLYLIDGHTRMIRHLINGVHGTHVRVLDIE